MFWTGRRHYRRTAPDRLAAVATSRYRSAMTNNLLTDEELLLLMRWHERRAQKCRGIDDAAAIAHDDRVIELQVIRDLCPLAPPRH